MLDSKEAHADRVELVGRISQQITEAIEQVQSMTPEFEQVSQTVEAQFEGAQQISVAISKLLPSRSKN
ncbi:hypothetical protein H6S82_24670, partial [Planktothrix sp. FACHB-1355]|nr:hypothetical protein [Planktothrix sp. FACHB-1355]